MEHQSRMHDVIGRYLAAIERPVERDGDVRHPEDVERLWQATFDAVDGGRGRSMDEVVCDFETESVAVGRDADRGRGREGGHGETGVMKR